MTELTSRQEWRAHWRVVVGTFLGMAVGYPAWSFCQSMFIKPLEMEFGWSRTQIAFAFNISIFLGVLAPLVGRLTDRIGVRRVLVTGFIGLGVMYLALANMSGAYGLLVVLYMALFSLGIGTTGVGFTRAVTSWFSKSLGSALAVSRIGSSLAGAGLPILMFHVISQHGWRGGYYLLSALALCIGLPMCWFLVRDRRPEAEAPGEPKPKINDLKLWLTLLRDRRVILISIAAACTYAPTIGILSQLQPMLTDRGLDPALAADFSGLLAISVVAGVLITGFLVDRIWAPLVGCVFTLIPTAGALLLMTPHASATTTGIAVIMIGLAQGAEIDVVAYMTARYFGMKAFGAIYGLSVFLIGLTTSGAAILFAMSHDKFGTYNPALMGAAAVFFTGSIAFLAMGKYPKEPGLRVSLPKPGTPG
jgi:sugar phosphate permease